MKVVEITSNELNAIYKRTNSVWKTADELGIKGQKVHEWLTASGLINKMNYFTRDEEKILINEYKYFRDSGNLKTLAKKMKRTVPFITRQAKELGLTDRENRISMKPFAKQTSERFKEYHRTHEHPKGMLGKHHSDETKLKFSFHAKKMWADPNSKVNSKENRQKQSDRMSAWQSSKENKSNNYTRTKFGWFEKDGQFLFMRSSWELNYAHYLNFLISKKQIKNWQYEADTFWFEKIKRGVRSYKPDFKVFENNGGITYHEVKGWFDNKSKTKMKRMRLYHPQIKIKLIGQKQYEHIKKTISPIIKCWGKWITKKPELNPRIEFTIKKSA